METTENRLVKYLKESREELLKVTWPSKKQLTQDTLVVLGVSIVIAAFLGALDMGFSRLIQFIIERY